MMQELHESWDLQRWAGDFAALVQARIDRHVLVAMERRGRSADETAWRCPRCKGWSWRDATADESETYDEERVCRDCGTLTVREGGKWV